MSKTKTHKGAAKRFKVTGTGKIKHRSPKLSKKLMKKSSSRKRRLRKEKVLSEADEKVVRKKLGI